MSLSPEKSGRHPRRRSRSRGPTVVSPESLKEGQMSRSRKTDALRLALQASNDDLDARMAQLVGNTGRLQRELLLLSRHFKEFDNPLMETWEADILTRLIEVSHVRQTSKLPEGVSIGEMNTAERENLSLAYSNAARRVQPRTLSKLGLGDKYHQAIQRYSEIVVYRSPNPFQTETPFAKWLVEERQNKLEKFAFWAKLYPICYGRTVYESANIY